MTPRDLRLPARFAAWRPHQLDAILSAAASPKQYVALCQPVGSGKSATYMALASLMDARLRVLTSTNTLLEQLKREFSSMGLVDIRGQVHYACDINPDLRTIEAECHEGLACELKEAGCTYFDRERLATRSDLTATNYAKWLTAHMYGEGLGPTDLLVCDEAHHAPEELSDFLTVKLGDEELEWVRTDPPVKGWKAWAATANEYVKNRASIMPHLYGNKQFKIKAKVRSLIMKLTRLAGANEDQWVYVQGRNPLWAPVWPGAYSQTLFRGVKKVILTSATIRPKTMAMLGIKKEDYDFLDYPSSFPVETRPIWWIPTARIDKKTTPEGYRAWINRIDEIIGSRLGVKGLIHTRSYDRAHMILNRSKYRHLMMVHDKHSTRSVIEQFRNASAPAVLVSPSISTGVEFPYDAARYQIIGKVPFPDTRDPLVKRRSAEDKEYPMYITMDELQQMVGRINRAEDDYGETFIIDDHVQWFVGKYRKFASRWFLDAYRRKKEVPEWKAAA